MPTGEGSVTLYIDGIRAGDESAARTVSDRYRNPLESYARRLLERLGASRAVADEEDLAQDVLAEVVDGIRKAKFPELRGREALVKLLRHLTRCRALKLKRYQQAGRRAAAPSEGPSAARAPEGTDDDDPGPPAASPRSRPAGGSLATAVSREPGPEAVAIRREELRAVLEQLPDAIDRRLLHLKMEGHTLAEIAGRLGCSRRQVSLRWQRVCAIVRDLGS